MTQLSHKLLLSELRMVVYEPGDPAALTDKLLCEAVTLNENLQSLGFVLRPEDLVKLAVSPSLHTFYPTFKALVPDVTAEPMYPGFPQQVMEMSAAEFRLHQMLHYFSTYGVEFLLGQEVSRGWLPDYEGPARTEDDTALFESRVLELVPEQDAAFKALRILLGRRERLTNPELELVLNCASLCTPTQMQGVKVRFKENLELLFPRLMGLSDRKLALRALHTVCPHTGDVLRCTAAYLSEKRWHLRTSEKKLLVKLLESYPVWNLRQNLMQSLQLRERNLKLLQHLDYNSFSRSAEHREAVRQLRNNELLSWYGVGEKLIREHDPKALTHLSERPGYMLRMLNRLLSLDYSRENLMAVLLPHANAMSAHLIVRTVRNLSGRDKNAEEKLLYRKWELAEELDQALMECDKWTIECRYQAREWQIERSYSEAIEKLNTWPERNRRSAACIQRARELSAEAFEQYIRKPQQNARAEAYADCRPLEEKLSQLSGELQAQEHLFGDGLIRNADHAFDTAAVQILIAPEKLVDRRSELRDEISELQNELNRKTQFAKKRFEQLNRMLNLKNGILYADRLEEIERQKQDELIRIEQAFRLETARVEQKRKQLKEQEAAELEILYKKRENDLANVEKTRRQIQEQFKQREKLVEGSYQATLRMCRYDATTVSILKELLKEHFRRARTPLKGKKIFCDLTQYDLAHSVLETEDRSKDGGYIRSGISYRIPEGAKYVRFFVYWDDENRVDVDLHAGGLTMSGETLHIGWNADYNNAGVVHSGDITHSNAAEYIDIDLSMPIREIYANINLFSGKCSLRDIQTCYVGMMAVDQLGQTVRHYNPANCFFTHEMTQMTRNLFYGYIDVQNRYVRFIGQPNYNGWAGRPDLEDAERIFSLQDYLDCVLEGQECDLVNRPEKADLILSMGKGLGSKCISLVDSNFFLES